MLFVKKITEDFWKENECSDRTYECKSLDEVLQSVRKLNGQERTIVHLLGADDMSLTIGGGNEGKYIVYATLDDTFYSLINPNASNKDTTQIVAGGQEGDYLLKQCLSLDTVIKACQEFVISGKLSQSLSWEEEQ